MSTETDLLIVILRKYKITRWIIRIKKNVDKVVRSKNCSSARSNEGNFSYDHPPLSKLSADTSEDENKNIQLEEQKEGFIGPRLPRMLTDEEVKAIFDRLLGDKYK